MQMKLDEFKAIEKARNILLSTEQFKMLSEEEQNIIIQADVALVKIWKRYKKDNERQKNYVADKRKSNKDFARGNYERKYFMVRVLKTDDIHFEWMIGNDFKAKKDGDCFLIRSPKGCCKLKESDVERI